MLRPTADCALQGEIPARQMHTLFAQRVEGEQPWLKFTPAATWSKSGTQKVLSCSLQLLIGATRTGASRSHKSCGSLGYLRRISTRSQRWSQAPANARHIGGPIG